MPQPRIFSRPPIVLVIGDQEWAAQALEELVGEAGCAVVRATPDDLSLQFVHDLRPDAVLVGCTPSTTGVTLDAVELAHRIRFATNAATPILITSTAVASGAERIIAHGAGAWDIMHLPIDRELFIAKMSSYVRAKREFDRVKDQSMHDVLHNVYSLRGITHRFREFWALAARMRRPLVCIALTVDFEGNTGSTAKDIQTQQAAVEYVATVCRRVSRTSDVIGRVSKTELAILASATTRSGAEQYVRRLEAALDAAPLVVNDVPRIVHLRAGISEIPDFTSAPTDAFEPLYRALIMMRRQHASPPVPRAAVDQYSVAI
jgi:GGDEF domain-containing protein